MANEGLDHPPGGLPDLQHVLEREADPHAPLAVDLRAEALPVHDDPQRLAPALEELDLVDTEAALVEDLVLPCQGRRDRQPLAAEDSEVVDVDAPPEIATGLRGRVEDGGRPVVTHHGGLAQHGAPAMTDGGLHSRTGTGTKSNPLARAASTERPSRHR